MCARKNEASNEIKLIREYDAPLKMVWEAFTDPKQAAHWWGPRGFTLTTHSKDFRAGGHWDYTMHGPDGTDYPSVTRYLEVEPLARIVYDHGGSKDRPPLFRVTALFSDVKGGKTRLELSFVLETPEKAEETRKFIKKAGGESTWDRFAEYLSQETEKREIFVINRSFDAPIELMYKLWSDPKHLANWLAPTGFETTFLRADLRAGGSTFSRMSGPNEMVMHGRADYVELESPRRIVYRQQFCDENEQVTRHPMSPTWPETMQTVVTLTEEGPDRTRVTITWAPYKATGEELETFIKARGGMTQGWTGSFDKLEEYVDRLSSEV